MAGVSQMLSEFQTWINGLVGSRLDAALVTVRAAMQGGTVDTDVQPRVQAFATTLGDLHTKTIAYAETARPFISDPDVEDRVRRSLFAYNTLYRQWTDKALTQRLEGEDQFLKYKEVVGRYQEVVGVAPMVGILVVVAIGSVAYGVSEAGAAWAMAAESDAKKALAQIDLQARDLDARVAASKDGRTLPPATVPVPSPSTWTGDASMDTALKAAVGLGAVVAVGAGVAWWLSGSRRS